MVEIHLDDFRARTQTGVQQIHGDLYRALQIADGIRSLHPDVVESRIRQPVAEGVRDIVIEREKVAIPHVQPFTVVDRPWASGEVDVARVVRDGMRKGLGQPSRRIDLSEENPRQSGAEALSAKPSEEQRVRLGEGRQVHGSATHRHGDDRLARREGSADHILVAGAELGRRAIPRLCVMGCPLSYEDDDHIPVVNKRPQALHLGSRQPILRVVHRPISRFKTSFQSKVPDRGPGRVNSGWVHLGTANALDPRVEGQVTDDTDPGLLGHFEGENTVVLQQDDRLLGRFHRDCMRRSRRHHVGGPRQPVRERHQAKHVSRRAVHGLERKTPVPHRRLDPRR